jgi:hypothetical protein
VKGDEEKIAAVIRPTTPASRFEPEEEPTPPKYDGPVVEAVILEVAVELHPKHLSAGALLLEILSDPNDLREIGTALQAILSLQGVGLLTHRTDERVEPTPAACRAVQLLK